MDERTSRTIQTYNKLGVHYLKNIEGLIPFEIEEFADALPAGAFVLELGCAGGRDSEFFVKKKFKVMGVDLSEVFIREAKKRIPQAKFICADVRKLDFPKESFHGIWANAILLHISINEIPGVLQSIYGLLKPGGLLHIRVKEGQGEKEVKDSFSKDVGRTFTFFSKEEIERFVVDAGLIIIKTQVIADEARRKEVNWISLFAKKN